MRHFRSSGDIIADRRFQHACDYAEGGDHQAAAELFEQTIERAPFYAPAWFELGKARLAAGRIDAADAFRRALDLEPKDALGASLYLARLSDPSAPQAAMGPAYVEALFDQYAPRFETHLVETLHYDGPALLEARIERACEAANRPKHFRTLLDIGCGTGLSGARFRPFCMGLEGCDLSSRMVGQAARKGVYDVLETADALTFLRRREASADLVLAADVLPYIGGLEPLFEVAAKALLPGGLFAFSAQTGETITFELGADLRFHHSASYIEGCARQTGLSRVCLEPKGVRRDRGVETPGVLVVLSKAEPDKTG